MLPPKERDMHRMPPPARTHLPLKEDVMNLSKEEEEPSETLLRLPAPALRGTYAHAYHLLTQLVFRVGWDRLRKYRPLKTEEWLDNLFKVLYEDIKAYTFWKTEYNHYRNQHVVYYKTGTEWELLGDLSLRLGYTEDAKVAYEHCVDLKFSAKAWMYLMSVYVHSDIQQALLAAVKLTVYHSRWYHDIIFPTLIYRHMLTLITQEGIHKIQHRLNGMKLPRTVSTLMHGYIQYADIFQ